MSQSPLQRVPDPSEDYLGAFSELSQRIREGHSFSGGERNCAFLNRGGGRFVDLSFALGLDFDDDGRGIALTDLDGDGDMDICTTNRTAPRLRLLRNDLRHKNQAVALQLVGSPVKGCPRDAIGARVEIDVAGGTRHRTLAAGSGFASQSSKWIHVGLGEAGEVLAVRVRWPGGPTEAFDGIAVSGRYVLKQGTGVAQALEIVASPPLATGSPPVPEQTDVARIRLSQPLKLPDSLTYEDLGGSRQKLAELTDRKPVLVNLWATWCPPCIAELGAFSRFADSNELEVVALCVDGLEGDVDLDAVAGVLRESGYGGRSGVANEEIVETFERLILESVYRHRGLPVPTSVLIDKGGWLTVVYKGTVSPERIMADVEKLGLGPDVARRESIPFPGRWAAPQFVSNPVAVAAAYREGGYLDDARAHLEQFLSNNPVTPGSNLSAKRSMQLADVHYRLGELHTETGDPRAALAHFKAAEHFNPRSVRLRLRRILALSEAGEHEDARREAELERAQRPATPDVIALCGDVALIAGDFGAAAQAFEATLKIDPKYVPAIDSLARIRATAADAEHRDGERAVQLAEFLMRAPGAKENPQFLATLAAAYAEQGEFEKASTEMANARRAALANGRRDLADAYSAALRQFSMKQPLREL